MQILIARIISPHGLKGEVKLISYLENHSDLEKYQNIFTKDKKNYQIKLIRNIKQNIYIAKINNINNRNQAEEIGSNDLFVNKIDLKTLPKNQFYHCDLINLKVKNNLGENVGIIKNIMNFGAGDLFEINFTDDKYKNQINILPFNKDIIEEVDVERGYVVFNEMDIL